MKALARFVPALKWLRGYQRADLGSDLKAGITVAVVLIPQGMAYAILVGVPPVYGLYAAIVPLFVYALLGTSRQLSIGPVAADSLLVGVAVAAVAVQGSEAYLESVILLTLLVGAVQLLLGLFRVGGLVTLLSRPVISGFMSGVAIVIALSQIKYLIGAPIPNAPRIQDWFGSALSHAGEADWTTCLMGCGACAALLVMRRISRRIPGPLVVVFLGTLLTWAFDLGGFTGSQEPVGLAVVGEVPSGIPTPSFPVLSLDAILALLPSALGIAFIGYMEAIGIGKEFARKNHYSIDANQELLALGSANSLGALFGGFPVTGGLSRSAVNAEAGARTPLAGAIAGTLLCLSLLVLTPLFYYLPLTVLAAVVITAVIRLVDIKTLRRLWGVRRSDGVLFVFTFIMTVTVGMLYGIGAGVIASIGLFVYRSTRPHHAVLGRLPGTTNYRNVIHFPEVVQSEGIKIWRFDASFYFANAEYFRDQVDQLVQPTPSDEGREVRGLVLDASGINDLDASGEAMLRQITKRLQESGIELTLANVKGPVREVMDREGLRELIGKDRFFFSVHEAVEAMEGLLAPSA